MAKQTQNAKPPTHKQKRTGVEVRSNSPFSLMLKLYSSFLWTCTSASCAKKKKKKNAVLNPFMPSGVFYFNSLDRFISYIRGVWLVIIIVMHVL